MYEMNKNKTPCSERIMELSIIFLHIPVMMRSIYRFAAGHLSYPSGRFSLT